MQWSVVWYMMQATDVDVERAEGTTARTTPRLTLASCKLRVDYVCALRFLCYPETSINDFICEEQQTVANIQ